MASRLVGEADQAVMPRKSGRIAVSTWPSISHSLSLSLLIWKTPARPEEENREISRSALFSAAKLQCHSTSHQVIACPVLTLFWYKTQEEKTAVHRRLLAVALSFCRLPGLGASKTSFRNIAAPDQHNLTGCRQSFCLKLMSCRINFGINSDKRLAKNQPVFDFQFLD